MIYYLKFGFRHSLFLTHALINLNEYVIQAFDEGNIYFDNF